MLGSVVTPAKSKASRENGKKGGRPKKKARTCAELTKFLKEDGERIKKELDVIDQLKIKSVNKWLRPE